MSRVRRTSQQGSGAYPERMWSIEQEIESAGDARWEQIVAELSDLELQEELMVAAMARGERRMNRFRVLLCERKRRWEERQR